MRILITGACGFIGFHLTKSYLEDGVEVFGIDNINNYYSVDLKEDRLKILKIFDNFNFSKLDISNNDDLEKVFKVFSPTHVINLAAQAGVRYSIENPSVYIDSNIVGFSNIIELCRKYNTEGLVYASSSSVYGSNKKFPFSVQDRTDNPISLYAATKKSNELIAHSYSSLFGLRCTGLRFFTAYGPWGRPDMAMYIFAEQISSKKSIKAFNNGNMSRDFTYIDDIVAGIKASVEKNYLCEVFNLGNNKSEKLMDVIQIIEQYIGNKAIIEYHPMQPGDVEKSHADIDKSIEMLNYSPAIDIKEGLRNFIDWFQVYKGTG